MKPIKTSTAIKKFRSQLCTWGMHLVSNTTGYWEYLGKGLRIRILSYCTAPTEVHIAEDAHFDRWANSTVFTITGIPMQTGALLCMANTLLRVYGFSPYLGFEPIELPIPVYPVSDSVETIRMFLVIPSTIHTVKAWIPNNAHIVDMNVDAMTLNVAHEAEFKDTGVVETYFKLKKTGSTIRSFHRDSRGACYTGHGYALIK